MNFWFEEISICCRDQISLPYCLWKFNKNNNLKIKFLNSFDDSFIRKNFILLKHKQKVNYDNYVKIL